MCSDEQTVRSKPQRSYVDLEGFELGLYVQVTLTHRRRRPAFFSTVEVASFPPIYPQRSPELPGRLARPSLLDCCIEITSHLAVSAFAHAFCNAVGELN